MRVSKIYNASLLQIIAKRGEITYSELKKEYCTSMPHGVISGREVMFDSELKVLESEGFIVIDEDLIKYLHR